ncbi:hypothetical protein ISCGN_006946 [Ixodes scapularis]
MTCCIPHCGSSRRKPGQERNFALHEIPSDPDERASWLQAIKRDDWLPSTYSMVCSRHFVPSDYVEGKRRKLKKGAIPSIFWSMPPSNITKMKDAIRRKCSTPYSSEVPKKRQCLDTGSSQVTDATSSSTLDTPPTSFLCNEGAERIRIIWTSPASTLEPQNRQASEVPDSRPCQQPVLFTHQGTQANVRKMSAQLTVEKRRWTRRVTTLRNQVERLKNTVDRYKKDLEKLRNLREEDDVTNFLNIREQAKEKNISAMFLVDQVKNYHKKSPRWTEHTIRHCILLRHISTKAYEHIRSEELFKLPSRNTLQSYIGAASGQTGFSDLAKARLQTELHNLANTQSRTCSLIIDEMQIKQSLQYNKQQDVFVGQVDLGPLTEKTKQPILANSLLCFLMNGLSIPYRIPVAYFFTKGLTGTELAKLLLHVLGKVEDVGFKVLRIVTDNHRVNVNAMKQLCGGLLTHHILHPNDPERILFLSFDYVHILKNIRSQFLERNFGKDNEIKSFYLKKLYELQREAAVKPVRFLSRKHLFPSNIEKMNAKRAVQLFSPEVTAVLKHLQEQAGHTSDLLYADAGPTIFFMDSVYRWFILHDTSNCTQHIHQRYPDVRQYDHPDDPRLEWLEFSFPAYLEQIKSTASPSQFLTTETYEALLLTTYSTVACVQHLLTKEEFGFVLTRKFSSDAIESLFGSLRRSQGCNDQLSVRAAISRIEKILKTGLITASQQSNVSHAASTSSGMTSAIRCIPPAVSAATPFQLPQSAAEILEKLSDPNVQYLPSLELSATAHVGGYIARVVQEHFSCFFCIPLLTKPKTNSALQGITNHLDRGGLLYPSDELAHLLNVLRMFAADVLSYNLRNWQPLETLVKFALPAVYDSPLLLCPTNNKAHRRELIHLVCTKFFRPLLVNYAFCHTDRNDRFKMFARKPLSRKFQKVR